MGMKVYHEYASMHQLAYTDPWGLIFTLALIASSIYATAILHPRFGHFNILSPECPLQK